jgi:hypothetical protein
MHDGCNDVQQNMIPMFPESEKVGINISVSHDNFTIRKQDISQNQIINRFPLQKKLMNFLSYFIILII